MLKRRTKKRRNPSMEEEIRERRLTGYDSLKDNIWKALKDGAPINFVKSMILYKRGRYCHDCDKAYYDCRCDDCEECGFVECLCSLNIDYKGEDPGNYTESERKLIKKEAYKFLIYILNDDLYSDGRKYNLIPNNFKKLKEDFLKNAINKSEIDLSKANLHTVDLSGANLSGANLSGADLCETDLSGADLSGADLSKTDLMVSNLSEANLSRANLHKALLNMANLSEANLSEANLSEASLYKTNFTNAIIKDTNFSNTETINTAINLIIPNPRKKSIRRRK